MNDMLFASAADAAALLCRNSSFEDTIWPLA
jgi:hypothetical protein